MLIPPTWELLGHEVGPFGPDELQIREYQKDPSQDRRKWQVRIAARPDVVSEGIPSHSPPFPRDLSNAAQVKEAVAHSLRALVSRRVEKREANLPGSFHF